MRYFYLILYLLLLTAGTLWAENSEGGFFPYQYQTKSLDNGFKTILVPMEGNGLVAFYTIIHTGSRDEWEPGKSGFAHFFEHMMFRGTSKHPSDVYDRFITEMGADANAYTTDDYTCYYMVISRDNLDKAMDLESDRFQNLLYKEPAFRTEAGAVYGEFRKNRTSPWSVAHQALCNTAFDKHTYKHTTMGFEADIKNMPNMFDYSKSFYNRYYRPENTTLMLVGDFDPVEAASMIDKYFGGWKRGYVKPKIEAEPEQKGERTKEVAYEGRTLPLIWMAYKGDAFDAANKNIAASFLLGDLAFGENSDIYKQLVIREQKVQFIGAEFGFNSDPKFYSVYTMVKNEADIPYVKEAIDKTAEKFKTDLIEEANLERIKKRTRYQFLMGLDTPGRVASGLARMIALTGSIDSVDQLYATIESVTREDIRNAANRYLQKNHRTVITLKGDR